MLHADINRSRVSGEAPADERRNRARLPEAVRSEIVITWDHNPSQSIRFRLVDRTDDGVRIASTLPVLSGLTGIAQYVLPRNEALNAAFSVAWSSEAPVEGEYHAGLRISA